MIDKIDSHLKGLINPCFYYEVSISPKILVIKV